MMNYDIEYILVESILCLQYTAHTRNFENSQSPHSTVPTHKEIFEKISKSSHSTELTHGALLKKFQSSHTISTISIAAANG